MKRSLTTLSYLLLAGAALLALPSAALAQSIQVDFEQTPLFSEGDVKPGDTIAREVVVENLSGSAQDVYVKAENGFQSGNLAETLFLSISDGTTAFLNSLPLSDFIDEVERPLTAGLPSGGTTTYTFSIYFPESAGNEYQGGTAGFDFCVGFSGGENSCISDGGDDDDTPSDPVVSTSSGGGGGGGILSSTPLDTFNEVATNITFTGEATINWNTNRDASSKVVFGPIGGSYSRNLTEENFGYPSGTTEVDNNTENHSVSLSGLTPGETYRYRVVSRENPIDLPTLSEEFTFTVPLTQEEEDATPPAGTPGGSTGAAPQGGAGGVGTTPTGTGGSGGAPEGATGGATEGETPEGGEGSTQAAAAFFGIPDFFDNHFSISECDCAWITTLIATVGFLLAAWWSADLLGAAAPIARSHRRFFGLALMGALGALGVYYMGYPCAMLPLLALSALTLLGGVIDYFTAASTLPFTRLVYILIVFIVGLVAFVLYSALTGGWCYVWPFIFAILILLIRLLYLRSFRRGGA